MGLLEIPSSGEGWGRNVYANFESFDYRKVKAGPK